MQHIATNIFIVLPAYANNNTLSVNNLAIAIPIPCGKYCTNEYTADVSAYKVFFFIRFKWYP